MAANDIQIGGEHYKKLGTQPWDVYEKWLGKEGFSGFLRGSCIKYLVRYKDKGGVQDLKKAQHVLARLIELEEKVETPKQAQCRDYTDRPLPIRCSCYAYYEVGSGVTAPCSVHPTLIQDPTNGKGVK